MELLEDRLVPATFFVTNATDTLNPGSLRYATIEAGLPGNEGSTVEITPQVVGPIVLTSGELSVPNSMTIRNDSGAPLEIRQATANARVFHVGSAAAAVTITGVGAASPITIDGGSASGGNGGGILVDGSSTGLTLSYVDVFSNSATADASGTGGDGGGIYAAGGTITLSGSSVSGNRAPDGEGGGINVAVGTVTVSAGSHVDGNSARDVGGIRVGNVVRPSDDAVQVVGGSTVNGNSSTATVNPATGDFGGGGIAAEALGNVYVSASQVNDNHTVGMYSGGIVVGLGSVTVTEGSQIDRNTNNGPGGGIAANFGGTVTVSWGSQVDDNTGAAIGGGIVNFAGPGGGVVVSSGSRVDGNRLTNAETLGQAIAVFLKYIASHRDLATAAAASRAAASLLRHPEGLLAGGGIGTLAAPIEVSGSSEVSDNICGLRVAGGSPHAVGLGGGIFSVLGRVEIDQSAVASNIVPYGNGGGIYNAFNGLTLEQATVSYNSAAGDGGGIWSGGVLLCEASTVADNTAGHDGGGLFNAPGGRAVVVTSAFTGNTAGHRGGGIADHGDLILLATRFADNSPDNVSHG